MHKSTLNFILTVLVATMSSVLAGPVLKLEESAFTRLDSCPDIDAVMVEVNMAIKGTVDNESANMSIQWANAADTGTAATTSMIMVAQDCNILKCGTPEASPMCNYGLLKKCPSRRMFQAKRKLGNFLDGCKILKCGTPEASPMCNYGPLKDCPSRRMLQEGDCPSLVGAAVDVLGAEADKMENNDCAGAVASIEVTCQDGE